jgi:hypothetical protein
MMSDALRICVNSIGIVSATVSWALQSADGVATQARVRRTTRNNRDHAEQVLRWKVSDGVVGG